MKGEDHCIITVFALTIYHYSKIYLLLPRPTEQQSWSLTHQCPFREP